jgi:deoxycytidylate deaminase
MATRLTDIVAQPHSELVLAVVAPAGTDLEYFQGLFVDLMNQFGYDTNPIRLSSLAQRLHTEQLGVSIDATNEYKRIDSLMTVGNRLREVAGQGELLALHAMAEINSSRPGIGGRHTDPLPKTAHLLRSLKHPDEVEALRRVYGPGFFLIALHSSEADRVAYFTDRKGMTRRQARALIARDESESHQFGQHTRDTFTLADVFIAADDRKQLARFLEIVFGHPFHTPTPDEHAMFLAYAASLRSAQLARQVGAVVVSARGEVIATGANDVPQFGGGQYWPGITDRRDHRQGGDSNDREIAAIITDTVKRLKPMLGTTPEAKVKAQLRDGRIGDLTEFGRVVHAEMEALLACGRSGVNTIGGTLYTTTFPCHNCTKHIVAAGIQRVVYVEPYPKSRALDLHKDSISIGDPKVKNKVKFVPFVGVASRRYFDMFSMRLGSGLMLIRKANGKLARWKRNTARPRLRMSPWSYMERERLAVEQIDVTVEELGEHAPSAAQSAGGPATKAEMEAELEDRPAPPPQTE